MMKRVTIDENTIQGKKLVAFLKTLDFVKVEKKPRHLKFKATKPVNNSEEN